jgi:hypothetical protein
MKQCFDCYKYFRRAGRGKICPFCESKNIGALIKIRGIAGRISRWSETWGTAIRIHNVQAGYGWNYEYEEYEKAA